MQDEGAGPNERVVLGRNDPGSWRGFEWTGQEPEGMYDTDMALASGAEWDGDELVTYNKPALDHAFTRMRDGWMEDSD